MKIKIYLFRLGVGFTAFVFGISVFNVGRYFQPVFSANDQKIESPAPARIEPITIEEITYPPQNIEQTKIPVVEQTNNSDETEPETEIWEFDGNGSFYITDDLPKGFKDFETINITTRDFGVESEDYPYGIPIPPEGHVRTSKKYKFTQIGIANRQIAFETEAKEDISYKFVTTEISSKLTSPTLVDFQPKSAAIPEWRLQLQNAVRQRKEHNQAPEEAVSPTIVHRTKGSAALKAEILELEEVESVLHENETVNNALRRIEQSRKMFYVEDKPKTAPAEATQKKDFPFHIAAKNDDIQAVKPETKTSTNFAPVAKPKLVSSLRGDKPDFDTNKLPPLPQAAKISTSFEKRPVEMPEKIETTITEPAVIEKTEEKAQPESPKIKISHPTDETEELIEAVAEEIEDCAPFAMRFNAGVFDILIGSFASLILLAPFILLGGDWFTIAGLFAFLATSAIVMFVYMTTAIGLFGKTFGMKLFSLEIIDIEENDYPTFHQAAVSSSVYLLSLALGGTGFLTVPFTADRRAVHDIVSGTVVVREYE